MENIDTDSYRLLRILRAIRENWPYLETFDEIAKKILNGLN